MASTQINTYISQRVAQAKQPVYDTRRISAEQQGAGVGRALEQLGGSITAGAETVSQVAKIKAAQDERDAQLVNGVTVDNKLNEARINDRSFLGQQLDKVGYNAKGSYDDALTYFKKQREAISTSLDNDSQRLLFYNAYDQHVNSYLGQIQTHQRKQMQIAQQSAIQNQIANDVWDAKAMRGSWNVENAEGLLVVNPDYNKILLEGDDAVREYGLATGEDREQIEASVRSFRQLTHEEVIKGLISDNLGASALQYYAKFKNEIQDPKFVEDMNGRIDDMYMSRTAQQMADNIRVSQPDSSQWEAEARKQTSDPEVRKRVNQLFKGFRAEDAIRDEAQTTNILNTYSQQIYQAKTRNDAFKIAGEVLTNTVIKDRLGMYNKLTTAINHMPQFMSQAEVNESRRQAASQIEKAEIAASGVVWTNAVNNMRNKIDTAVKNTGSAPNAAAISIEMLNEMGELKNIKGANTSDIASLITYASKKGMIGGVSNSRIKSLAKAQGFIKGSGDLSPNEYNFIWQYLERNETIGEAYTDETLSKAISSAMIAARTEGTIRDTGVFFRDSATMAEALAQGTLAQWEADDIPDEDQELIIMQLRKEGKAITDDNIARVYNDSWNKRMLFENRGANE